MAEDAENQLDREVTNEEVLVCAKEIILHMKHRWLGHVLQY